MQAVLLAAGESSRFNPYNNFSHKSLVKVMGKKILEHTLSSVKKAGISDVVVVCGKDSKVKEAIIGNGNSLGLRITYLEQEQSLGMGNALLLAKDYLKEDFFLLNAYHFDFFKFSNLFKLQKQKDEVILLARKDSNLSQYGILKTEKDKVLEIIEKPKKGEEPSSLRIIGIYLLSKKFLDILKETPLEHYHLEKALSSFAKKGLVRFVETNEESVSLKYPWDLLSLKNFLFKDIKGSISKNSKIAKSAEIDGKVIIEDGVNILGGAKIKGPCFIGKNTLIGNNAILRGGVDIGENCVVGANMEIKNSLIMSGSKTHSGYIGDSIIGVNCRIAAQFCTANRRLDRGFINAQVKGEKVNTGFNFLGAIIGSDVSIGIKSSTMPGVIIGNNSLIGPSTIVQSNVLDNTKYYSKFEEMVSKK